MAYPIRPLFVDLSHWDPASSYSAVKEDGMVGVIFKATEGSGYTDPTYVQQQQSAKAAGLKWGAYHFATAATTSAQIDNFMRYASPDPDELFCLDWEDYGDNTMSLSAVKEWIAEVEKQLDREGECVLYSGNTAKEALGDDVDTFLGARRLWLCQYGSEPKWQKSWKAFWAWQFTDGISGPQPHSVSGVGACDINSYDYGPERLALEWATGKTPPRPIPPPQPVSAVVTVVIDAPPGVEVRTRVLGLDITNSDMDRLFEGR
jgi:lysozyme